jgi:hypothetical protein
MTELHDEKRAEGQHEPDGTWAGWVAIIGGGLLLMVILALLGIWIAFKTVLPHQPLVGAEVEWNQQQAAPGVEPNQAYGREKLLAEEETFLGNYAWLDEERGIARIPIERGIEIMAERKLIANWPAIAMPNSTDGEAK